jgi:Zinc-binding dehydrogenase/Thiolase, N-terminal domain
VKRLMQERFGVDSMPETAENVAQQFGIGREAQDRMALSSQLNAVAAQRSGVFGAGPHWPDDGRHRTERGLRGTGSGGAAATRPGGRRLTVNPKLERAVARGADEAVNSTTQDIAKTVLALTGGRGVDVVVENVGAAVWGAALKSLVRGGRLVTCGATSGDQPGADLRRMFIRQLKVFGSTLGTLAEFADLLALCSRIGLRPVIDSRHALANVTDALDRLESGRQFGKVVVTIGG